MHAGARADIDDVIGAADRIFVVLNDDYRVAEVAQIGQRREQALVIALVQADRRLVQHVHHADQSRAYLAGQPDPLGLAAGQRLGAAVERQVVESDVDQEAQAFVDLLDDLRRDLALLARQVEVVEEREAAFDRHRGDRRQRVFSDEHIAGTLVEPRAAALRAVMGGDITGQLLAHCVGFGLAVATLHVVEDALERVALLDDPAAVVEVAELDRLEAAAAQYGLADLVGQVPPGGLGIEAEMLAERADHLEVVSVAAVPATHRAAGQRKLRVADDLRWIEILLDAQTVAAGAGADRIVERK